MMLVHSASRDSWIDEKIIRQAQPVAAETVAIIDSPEDSTSLGLGYFDRDFRVIHLYKVLAHFGGVRAKLQIGRTIAEDVPGLWSRLGPRFHQVAITGEALVGFEVESPPSSEHGFVKHWLSNIHPVKVNDDLIGFTVVTIDDTVRKQLETELQVQALHDTLTGLPNRALFLDRTERLLEVAHRDHAPVSTLFIDLDNFKTINDGLSHVAGDELLIAVAKRITGALRGVDTVCRFGGDKFAVLINSHTNGVPAEHIAERIKVVMRTPFAISGQIFPITASIGIARGNDISAEELVHEAEIAMYQAKAAGKNTIVTFLPQMQALVRDRLQLEMDLNSAFENREFTVLYQPMIDLRRHVVTGMEALVRWNHPSRGCLEPSEFIGLVEENGQIVKIGLFVLREACSMAARCHRESNQLSLAVKLSVRQLESNALIDDLRNILDDTGLDPASLVLEITETAIMRDAEAIVGRLKALKSLGVRLAIDDFGTGYSSLSYLGRFPFDILKIDRSFVADLQNSDEARAIIRSLIGLGKALNLEIVAEGVELKEQLTALELESCDVAQGYLFTAPLQPERFDKFLEEWTFEGK